MKLTKENLFIIKGLVTSVIGLILVKKFPALAGIIALVVAGVLAWAFFTDGIPAVLEILNSMGL